MKKFLLATSAIAALVMAAPASAADLRVKAQPMAPPPPPCAQFGGFYVGGNVGWGYGDHTFRSLDSFEVQFDNGAQFGAHEVSRSVSGATAGIQGGYNWQSRCTLFGIEADYNWTDIDHDFDRTGRLATLRVSSNLQGFGTIRARSGVIVDNLLLYVTGGFAYANTERTVALIVPTAPEFNQGPFTDEKTRWGWTMGFGTEWQIAPNWSFKSEVLYARFETGEATHTCVLLCGGVPTPLRFEHESSAWVTRMGINYRFGGGGYGGYGGGY